MSGILCALAGIVAQSGGTLLDTQNVTVGVAGTVGNADRRRGFISGDIGSISDGTSNIYSGAAITALAWTEDTSGIGSYILTIPSASNSGWSSIVIGSQTLLRTDATYSFGSWEWYPHLIGGQQFGNTAGVVVPVYFYA